MTQALDKLRARYEATPRSLDDDELTRIARGDRGCLGDVLSGLGGLLLITTVILGAMGTISFSWTYVAMGVWIAGFAWGTTAQSRSGKQRQAALESGPLVLGVVLREEPWLRRPGKRAGRVVVLFSTAEPHRFDRAWLEAQATHMQRALEQPGSSAWMPVRTLLLDPDGFGMHRVPAELLQPATSDDAPVWLASVIVHPERLSGGYLGAEEDAAASDRGEGFDAPTRPPVVLVIVDPERGFIEQVPGVR